METKRKDLVEKLVAILIILVLNLSHNLFVGKELISYAIDVVKTNNFNVEFFAYFVDSNGEKQEKLEEDINSQDVKMMVEISVKNEGYFNGKIKINNSNFIFSKENESEYISEISENEVKLNQINAANTVSLPLKIVPKKEDIINLQYLDTKTEIQLEGEYVDSKSAERNETIGINGKDEVELIWKSSQNINAELDGKIITNYIYKENENEKRIVQILVNSKITNNNYPVKNTEINLGVPDIVENIKVHARTNNATNKNINFNENNYTYDKQNKNLKITLNNEDENNISWSKDCYDTFIITYVLNKEENITNKTIKMDSIIKTYDNKTLTANKDVEVKEEIDGIISYKLTSTENEIYKGKIYTGEERELKRNTIVNIDYINVVDKIEIKENEATYSTNENEVTANILYKNTKINKAEFIKIFGEKGYITIKDQNGITIGNINKDSSQDENGNIVIQYMDGVKGLELTTSKPTNIGTIQIQHTKVIKEEGLSREIIDSLVGIKENTTVYNNNSTHVITLNNTKTDANINLNVSKISTLSDSQDIILEAVLKANDETKNLYKNPQVTIILPQEITVNSAQVATLYKNELKLEKSEIIKNENRQNQINLAYNGEQTKYNVGGGTKIYLKLNVKANILTPSKKSKVEMTYTNEYTNETNQTFTELEFESQYGLMIYNQMLNINKEGNSVSTIDKEQSVGTIDAKSKEKEIVLNTALINNYGETIKNIELIGKIPNEESKESFKATLNNIQANNENAKIYYSNQFDTENAVWQENVTNAKSYKIVIDEMQAEQKLLLNVPITLQENIQENKQGEFLVNAKCEYQNSIQTNSSSIMLKTASEVTENIVPKNTFQLNETPVEEQKIAINVSTLTGTDELVNGSSVSEGQTIKYKVNLKNNTGRDLNNFSLIATGEDRDGNSIVTFFDNVKTIEYDNTTGAPLNVIYYRLNDKISNKTFNKDVFKAGEELNYEYEFNINNNQANKFLISKLKMTADDFEQNQTISENTIEQGDIQLLSYYTSIEKREFKENETTSMLYYIKNITDKDLTNLDIKINIPDGAKFGEFSKTDPNYTFTFDNDGILTYHIDKLNINEEFIILVYFDIDKISRDKLEQSYVFRSKTEVNDKTYYSNNLIKTAKKQQLDLDIEYVSDNDMDITFVGQKITFTSKIKNICKISDNVKIEQGNTANLKAKKAYIIENGEKRELDASQVINEYGVFSINQILEPEQSIEIVVECEVIEKETDPILVESNLLVYGDKYTGRAIKSNAIQYDIVLENTYDYYKKEKENENTESEEKNNDKENEDNNNNNGNEENEDNNSTDTEGQGNKENQDKQNEDNNGKEQNKTNTSNNNITEDNNTNSNNSDNNTEDINNKLNKYTGSISGMVWLDKNKNGIKDDDSYISNVQVLLIDGKTKEIVQDENNTECIVKSGQNGKYSFTNIKPGSYMVAFVYDNTKYEVTAYQKEGIPQKQNSDVTSGKLTLNNKETLVALTDEIQINENSAQDIDAGLVENKIFDLSLEKTISKVTYKTSKQTKTKEFNDKNLAKVEIRRKEIENAEVTVEYKIKVKNEGEIEGYAKQIVDYIPQDMEFSTRLNKNWYVKDGSLYNDSLANTIIKPGESKEVTLILTKTMTQSNTGINANIAEISKSSNNLGVKDKDSTPSNKNQKEDDISTAELIISISTGGVKIMIGSIITLIILTVVGIILYNQKKGEMIFKYEKNK